MKYSSECVLPGHPDKVADLISDAVVDFYVSKYKILGNNLRVAIETLIKDDKIYIAGEVFPFLNVLEMENYIIEKVRKHAHLDVSKHSFYYSLSAQSLEIAKHIGNESLKSGDQSVVYGYAVNDKNCNYLPKAYFLSSLIARELFMSEFPIGPDGKVHVDTRLNKVGLEIVDKVTVSLQHRNISICQQMDMRKLISSLTGTSNITINLFTNAGSFADCGVTGRKLMVDTYGGLALHGGGAFSGKDPSKVDRTAAYFARFIAVELIKLGFLKEATVSISFDIGRHYPNFIRANSTKDTISDIKKANEVIQDVYDKYTFNDMIEFLNMWTEKYCELTNFGHFRDDLYRK